MTQHHEATHSTTIVVFNPSHLTPTESTFWESVAQQCTAHGWRLVQVAARKIPPIAGADTVVMPARLADFDRWIGPECQMSPTWLTETDVARHSEWEHRRWELPHYNPRITTAVRKLASFVDRIVEHVRPAIVLTTNMIDHPCALGRLAAQHHGVPVVGLIERSPFGTLWFEDEGLFTDSAIWDESASWRSVSDADLHGQAVVDDLLANPAGFRIDEASTARLDTAGWSRPLVVLPLDNLLWTGWLPESHPQGDIDYPILRTPAEAIETVAAVVEQLGGTLLVKAHPSCVETKQLVLPPGTHLVDAAIDDIIGQADTVVAFNSKVAFASVAAGVPTVTLANNPVAAQPGMTTHWADHASPTEAIEHALTQRCVPRQDDVAQFFGRLDTATFYGSSSLPISERSTSGAQQLFIDLTQRASFTARLDASSHSETSLVALRVPADRAGPAAPNATGNPERTRVIIQASRLVDPGANVSGIARYGRALIAGLAATPGVEVYVLVIEPERGMPRRSGPDFEALLREFGDRLISAPAEQIGQALENRLGRMTNRDVIHSIHLPLPPTSATGDAVRVITIHDVLHLSKPEYNPTGQAPTIQRVLDSLDPVSDVVICDSEQTRRDLLARTALAGDRVRTVLLGVDEPCSCNWTASMAKPASKYILMMLQGEPRKNCEAGLQAFQKLVSNPSFKDITLVLVGSKGAIDAHASALERIPADRRAVLPALDDHDIHHLMAGALAFVYPSLYEGFGLPPLEAMAAGCPVVAGANSSLVEVLGDAAMYAHAGSAAELTVALEQLLRSDTLQQTLRRSGRRRAAELAWTHTIRETHSIYLELTPPAPSGAEARMKLYTEFGSLAAAGKIIFLHLPKVGGRSVNKLLRDVFDKQVSPIKQWSSIAADPDFSREHHVFTGHFFWRITDYFPDDETNTIAFFREPVSRIISEYEFIRRTPEHPRHQLVSSQTISEFVSAPTNLITYCRFLGFDPTDGDYTKMQQTVSDEALLSRCKDRITSMAFVGITEHFNEYYRELEHCLGVRPQGDVPTRNIAPRPPDDLPDELERLIRQRAWIDCEIYEHAIVVAEAQRAARSGLTSPADHRSAERPRSIV